MSTQPAGAPPGSSRGNLTYRGFSAPVGAGFPEGASPRRPPSRSAVVAGALAAAVVLGLLVGLWARPDLGRSGPEAPMRAVTPPADQAAGPAMAIEVAKPTPEPGSQARSAGKLEVLPPGLARAASPPVQAVQVEPRAQAVSAPVIDPPAQPPRIPTVRPLSMTAPPPAAPALPPQAAPRLAEGPCAGAASRAAQMVCADPELAAADREMARAYRRALQASASPELLRREQQQWLAIREDAARRSPGALTAAYDQRIGELEDAAEDGPS